MILNVWYSIHVPKQARCGRGESDLRERLCKYASTRSACSHKQDLFHLISYWNHFLQLQIPFNKPAYFKEIVKYKLKYVMIFTFRKSLYIYKMHSFGVKELLILSIFSLLSHHCQVYSYSYYKEIICFHRTGRFSIVFTQVPTTLNQLNPMHTHSLSSI